MGHLLVDAGWVGRMRGSTRPAAQCATAQCRSRRDAVHCRNPTLPPPHTTTTLHRTVSPKTMQHMARDAKAAGKASFAYAWVLDEEADERAR